MWQAFGAQGGSTGAPWSETQHTSSAKGVRYAVDERHFRAHDNEQCPNGFGERHDCCVDRDIELYIGHTIHAGRASIASISTCDEDMLYTS